VVKPGFSSFLLESLSTVIMLLLIAVAAPMMRLSQTPSALPRKIPFPPQIVERSFRIPFDISAVFSLKTFD